MLNLKILPPYMGYNKLLLKGLFKMYKNLELKNFKNKIINLCDNIADSLDILEFGSKSSDTKILVRRIELLVIYNKSGCKSRISQERNG